MIIFGWGKKTARKAGRAGPYLCGNCHNVSLWALSIVTSWFSLFFVPVIPYRREYMMTCGVCREGTRLEKAEFEELAGRGKAEATGFR